MSKKKAKFLPKICVVKDADDSSLYIIAGNPSKLSELAADDGDSVAVYKLDYIATYRTQPDLQP